MLIVFNRNLFNPRDSFLMGWAYKLPDELARKYIREGVAELYHDPGPSPVGYDSFYEAANVQVNLTVNGEQCK